jgi:hypothetical protein
MTTPALFHESLGAYVRYRSRTGMRDLTLSQDSPFYFSAAEGLYDRINVRLNATMYVSHEDEHDSVLGIIGENLDPDSVLRATQKRPNQHEIYTLKNRWLFGLNGTLNWTRQARKFTIDAELRLNPTRFLAHQQSPDLDVLANGLPEEVLRYSETRHRVIATETLDGQSNALIGLDYIGSTTFEGRSARRQRLMAIYLEKITQLLGSALHNPDHNYTLDSLRITTVSDAEIYWELSHPDAISFVADFSSAVSACDRNSQTVIQRCEIGGDGNVRWIKLPLTQAISLKVYAKTADRVRCEITFSGDRGRIGQLLQRGSGANRSNPVEVLDALRLGAAGRLQRAWGTIMRLTGFSDETAHLLDFVERVDRSVPSSSRRAVFSLLFNHGGVAQTGDDGLMPASVCRALCREGILVETTLRQRAGKSFALTPTYARVCQILSGRSAQNYF